MQNETKTKQSSNPKGIFKTVKDLLEKLNTKEDSSKTTISNVLTKISHRKKTSKQQYNLCKAKTFAMISLEDFFRSPCGGKFLRERKIKATIRLLSDLEFCRSPWNGVGY